MQSISDVQEKLRKKRVIEVLIFVEVALAIVGILRVDDDPQWESIAMFSSMAFLSIVYFLIKSGRLEFAVTILIGFITTFCIFLMWMLDGLQDEVIVAFPSLLVISALLANRKTYLVLLAAILINIIMLGYVSDAGWITYTPPTSNLFSGSILAIIILATAFSAWLLSNDLRNALLRLSDENVRVLKSEQKIQHLVYFDNLTNLPNRLLAEDRFNRAMQLARRENSQACLMFLDLDGFKAINDSLGHSAGDIYLKEIAQRIVASVRSIDTVCRLGGDEFLIILESISTEQHVLRIAENILHEIRKPFKVSGVDVTTSASIGISMAPNDGNDFDTLCKKADLAMYHSKDIGRNSYHFYDNVMEEKVANNVTLLSELRTALLENQLVVYYQPKISLKTNKVIGAEALLRWNHPRRGLIPPIEFIPLAEASGLIVEIGERVINQACQNCKEWTDDGLKGLSVAVNISAVQLKNSNFSACVKQAIKSHQLFCNNLELELTESIFLEESDSIKSLLTDLKSYGVKLSIDDFGTGYSNLGYLTKMEVGTLKIDRSFISQLLANDQERAIVESIIFIASRLNLETVAVGVETDEIAEILRQLNCDYAQGFHWAPALSNSQFIDFTKSFNEYKLVDSVLEPS